MPYQHFFMFHDVTKARQGKLDFSAELYATFTSDAANLLETNTNLP
jgi:HPt (histidine-containing phosphotransfer) domain-containing protein